MNEDFRFPQSVVRSCRKGNLHSLEFPRATCTNLRKRARPKSVGSQDKLIIWHPFKPIFFKVWLAFCLFRKEVEKSIRK